MREDKHHFITELFHEQGSGLVKYLTARFKNHEEAEEVAKEAWVRLYRLDHPEDLDNAKAFLFQTASNLSIDRLRRRLLEFRHNSEAISEEPSRSIEESLQFEQAVDIVENALYELPLKCRQAFVMHRHSGLSYPQIASQLGVSTSMVEKYMIQALKHLRNKLEQNETEG